MLKIGSSLRLPGALLRPSLTLLFQCANFCVSLILFDRVFINRKKDDDTYEGTTWQIKFQLDNVNQSGTFKLQISLATANIAELQVGW